VQNQSDGKRYWKISKGRAIERHPEEDRWALVRFIRVLARGLRWVRAI